MMFAPQPPFVHVTLQGMPWGHFTGGFSICWNLLNVWVQLVAGSLPSQTMLHTPPGQPPLHAAGHTPAYGGSGTQTCLQFTWQTFRYSVDSDLASGPWYQVHPRSQ